LLIFAWCFEDLIPLAEGTGAQLNVTKNKKDYGW
jgi:hypothetical protein